MSLRRRKESKKSTKSDFNHYPFCLQSTLTSNERKNEGKWKELVMFPGGWCDFVRCVCVCVQYECILLLVPYWACHHRHLSLGNSHRIRCRRRTIGNMELLFSYRSFMYDVINIRGCDTNDIICMSSNQSLHPFLGIRSTAIWCRAGNSRPTAVMPEKH